MTGASDNKTTDSARYGFLSLLRQLERQSPEKPRIGKNERLKDEIVSIGQDPFLSFPKSDFSDISFTGKNVPELRQNIFGFFGPQGALPLNTTEEVRRWVNSGDDSFVKFTDIFATRFFQLYFRAWSNSHAISQFDNPGKDRFQMYVNSLAGVGTPAYRKRDNIQDVTRMPLVSLISARVKSPVRLKQMIEQHLGADISIEEHVPAWLEFEEDDQCHLGQQGSVMGQNTYMGSRLQSIGEKICLHIRTYSIKEYRSYLPGGDSYRQLCDMVFWYLGKTMDVEIELSLPRNDVPAAKLGETTELGWMAALKKDDNADNGHNEIISAATFALDISSNREAA